MHFNTQKSLKLCGIIVALSLVQIMVHAQNKSLGVGTSSPNTNAALHVASPTNNQGVLFPGLTTSQRVALSLTATDEGLIVYDTDLNTIFLWEGTQWTSSGDLESNGNYPALTAVNYSTSQAGVFGVDNPSSNTTALLATTNATGAISSAIYGVTSTAFAGIVGEISGGTRNAYGVVGLSSSSNTQSFSILGLNTGSGMAGVYQINNAANTSASLYATTNGTGTTFAVNHTGASGQLAAFQSSGVNVTRIDKTGRGFFNGGTQNSGADVAEMFDVEGERNEYEPGDVLVISENNDRTVEKSNAPNSRKVAGVFATKPGVLLTEKGIEENLDDLVPMGVVGVIPTKVCLENGPIKRGDLLVTSSTKGHAMKAAPQLINGIEIYPVGAILGKALENFDNGTSGLIKVLVNVK